MTFRFIHTADWQIAKPFGSFPAQLAGELSAARLSAISRIAAIARQNGAAHVLVAGDVFDNDRLDARTLRRALEHMRTESDIAFLLLPGNHDPAQAGGLWERIGSLGLPGNVTVLDTAHVHALSEHCVVLPAPLTTRAPGRDPTEWMVEAPSAPGQIRIGLAHGSIQDFSSEGDSNAKIAPDRAARAGLDYLALGDWHGMTRIDARTWYSGTPEPDRFPDNDPGHVLAVSVPGAGAPPVVVPVKSAHFTWMKRDVMLADDADLTRLDTQLTQLAPALTHVLLRLRLTGSLTLAQEASLRGWRDQLEGRLRHLDVDDSALDIRASTDDLEFAGADGALRDCAQTLAALSTDDGGPNRATATRALRMLYAFTAKTRGEAS